MDTTLSIVSAPAPVSHNTAPAQLRAQTTKVHAATQVEDSTTSLTNKPYVAQVVNARLAGTDFPDGPTEIAPPERTLRPYDVPMLPFDPQDTANQITPADNTSNGTEAEHTRPSSKD